MLFRSDAVDELQSEDRSDFLRSLQQIIQAANTRLLLTGRPHILPEIGRRLPGRVTSVSISPKKGDIIRFLHDRLDEDTIPDAMDSSLEADILKNIPEDISEM